MTLIREDRSRLVGRPTIPLLFVGGLIVLFSAALLHIGLGTRFIPPATIIEAIFRYDRSVFDHVVIVSIRLPRLLIAMAVGAALGLAGATIQSVTRNPLADPGLMGMNAGAALAVVIAMVFAGIGVSPLTPWIAAAGAGATFGIVLVLSSAGRSGPTPLKVTLSGVAISAFAGAITTGLLLLDDSAIEDMRLWLAGNIAGARLATLGHAGIPMMAGLLIALAMAPRLNAMALGDSAATALGVRVGRARTLSLVGTALLAGAAVSVAGPISFLGLVVPHAVRLFVPNDSRLILLLSILVGAAVLVLADIASRVILAPQEIAAGILTAALGAPLFVALVKIRL